MPKIIKNRFILVHGAIQKIKGAIVREAVFGVTYLFRLVRACDGSAVVLHGLHAVSAAGLAQRSVQLSPMWLEPGWPAVHTARRSALL